MKANIANVEHVDESGGRWLIVEAVSMAEALAAVAMARVRGCTGNTVSESSGRDTRTLAEVRRVPAGTIESVT